MRQRDAAVRAAEQRRILELVGRIPKHSLLFSEHWRSQKEGHGFEVARIRDSDFGDEFEELDLEDFVRGERSVIVRRALRAETLMVFRDVSSSSVTFYPEAPEYSKIFIGDIASAILVISAYHTTTPVGAIRFSDAVEHMLPPQAGEYVLHTLDQMLAYEPEGEKSVDFAGTLSAMGAFSDSIICVISDFQDPAVRDGAELWHLGVSQMDIVPIVIRDPMEQLEFSGKAHALVRDPGSGAEVAVRLTKTQWEDLRQESERYYARLYARFDELRMPYVALDTPDVDECHRRLREFFAKRAPVGTR